VGEDRNGELAFAPKMLKRCSTYQEVVRIETADNR
jgi:hypothetical protein